MNVKLRTIWNGTFMLFFMLSTMFALNSCNPDEDEETSHTENNVSESPSENSSGSGGTASGTSSAMEFRLTKCTLMPGSTSIGIQAYFSKEPSSVKVYYGTGISYELYKTISTISGTKAITTLTALKRNTKYYVQFVAKDKNMKTYESSKYSTITTK